MSTTSTHDPLAAAMGSSTRTTPATPAELAPHLPEFEIQSLLGQGGMGAVYRVRRISDGRAFALKVVQLTAGHEAAFTARFAREAEALERLRHPNIVAIHGHGQGGPWCWLLMDLIDGANLREIVATGRLSPTQTLALVPPLCAALQYAHDQGVIHRDLKPENILLDAAGVPHLVDFGLAKLRDSAAGSDLTNTGVTMGTVHYMAPEQVASAKGVDHRADIYALGVVIYELLTGQLPLGRFESPSQRVRVDVRIDEVVLKALERDPERRWQQMRQVGQAMESATPVMVSAPAWVRMAYTNYSTPVVRTIGIISMWIVGGCLLLLLSVMIGGLWSSIQSDRIARIAMGLLLSGTFVGILQLEAVAWVNRHRIPAPRLASGDAWRCLGLALILVLMTYGGGQLGGLWSQRYIPHSQFQVRTLAPQDSQNSAAVVRQPGMVPPPTQSEDPTCVIFAPNVSTAARQSVEAKLRERITLNYDSVKAKEVLDPLLSVVGFRCVFTDPALGETSISLALANDTVDNGLRAIGAMGRFEFHYSSASPDIVTVHTNAVKDSP